MAPPVDADTPTAALSWKCSACTYVHEHKENQLQLLPVNFCDLCGQAADTGWVHEAAATPEPIRHPIHAPVQCLSRSCSLQTACKLLTMDLYWARAVPPGNYYVVSETGISIGQTKDSQVVFTLSAGHCVEVVEVLHAPNEERVRGRIVSATPGTNPQTAAYPAGWISLVNTADGNTWVRAIPVLEIGPYMTSYVLNLRDSACIATAQTIGTLLDSQSVDVTELVHVASDRRVAAKVCLYGWISLLNTSTGYSFAKALPLGNYSIIHEGTRLNVGQSRNSETICNLSKGQCVDVLEVVHIPTDKRVRGRVAGGWISLLNTTDGSAWATVVPVGTYITQHEATRINLGYSIPNAKQIGTLSKDQFVNVVEVIHVPGEERVRAKICLTGWISSLETAHGIPYMKPVGHEPPVSLSPC